VKRYLQKYSNTFPVFSQNIRHESDRKVSSPCCLGSISAVLCKFRSSTVHTHNLSVQTEI